MCWLQLQTLMRLKLIVTLPVDFLLYLDSTSELLPATVVVYLMILQVLENTIETTLNTELISKCYN